MIECDKKYVIKVPHKIRELLHNPLVTEVKVSLDSNLTISTERLRSYDGEVLEGKFIHISIPFSWLHEIEDPLVARKALVADLYSYIKKLLKEHDYVVIRLGNAYKQKAFAITQQRGILPNDAPIYVVTNKGVKGINNNLEHFLDQNIGQHDRLIAISTDNALVTKRYLHLEYNPRFIDSTGGYNPRLCKWSTERLNKDGFRFLLTSEWLEDSTVESLEGGVDEFNEFRKKHEVG